MADAEAGWKPAERSCQGITCGYQCATAWRKTSAHGEKQWRPVAQSHSCAANVRQPEENKGTKGTNPICKDAFGKTDDYGFEAIEDKVHVHDWHATILHLLGLDHENLTYRYSGHDMRLTDVKGNVVKAILE